VMLGHEMALHKIKVATPGFDPVLPVCTHKPRAIHCRALYIFNIYAGIAQTTD